MNTNSLQYVFSSTTSLTLPKTWRCPLLVQPMLRQLKLLYRPSPASTFFGVKLVSLFTLNGTKKIDLFAVALITKNFISSLDCPDGRGVGDVPFNMKGRTKRMKFQVMLDSGSPKTNFTSSDP